MKPEAVLEWFTTELLPEIVKNGKFTENGENQTLDKCEFEAVEKYVSSFASVACFANLSLKTQSGTVSRDVIVKFQSQDPLFREKMRMEQHFANEDVLYNQVYPSFVEFLKTCGQPVDFLRKIIPKCHFASNGDGDVEKAVVILEDLRGEGFRVSDSQTDLDLKHCLLSVEKLAGFHSLSLAMKMKGWKDLDKLKKSFFSVWLEDVPVCRELSDTYMGYVANRGIDYLSTRKEVPVEYLNKLRSMFGSIFELHKGLTSPTEPLSVIYHGDFNRNNILYKYVDGEVVDARLIDFQRVSYGSPSLDLGFIIYMNTTQEFRERHFEQIFDHYYSSIVRNVSLLLKEPEDSISRRIPAQAFLEDFAKVAIYHYTTVSFFLPIMMTPPNLDFEAHIKCKTFRQMAEENYAKGGDVVSRRIADVIVDFYERGFYL